MTQCLARVLFVRSIAVSLLLITGCKDEQTEPTTPASTTETTNELKWAEPAKPNPLPKLPDMSP